MRIVLFYGKFIHLVEKMIHFMFQDLELMLSFAKDGKDI